MTAYGRRAAAELAELLPQFRNKREARRELFRRRTEALECLAALTQKDDGPRLDRSPGSLAELEDWYFELQRRRRFKRLGTSRAEFETCMAFYLGAVAARSGADAQWVVEPFPFASGGYEIGVRKGLTTVMVDGMCGDWFKQPNNARHRALLRKFNEWFGAKPPKRRKAKPSPADDDSVRAAIIRDLSLKSSPLIYPSELWVGVEHRLRPAKVLKRQVDRVARSLETAGIIEKVALARGRGFRYRLVRNT